MLTVLLETNAPRQRRTAGATFSISLHLAIVAAIAATATRVARQVRDAPIPIPVQYARLATATPQHLVADVARDRVLPRLVSEVPVVVALITIPVGITPIVNLPSTGVDSITVGPRSAHERGLYDVVGGSGTSDAPATWSDAEVLLHVIVAPPPRYPPLLRDAGIEGSVVVRFVVDSTGRVDMHGMDVVASTNALFTDAVRQALPAFRFRPATAGGRHVPMMAEMPFEFAITR